MKRFFLVILFSLFSMSAVYAAEAGKILFVYGKAEIVRDKNTLVAKRGALIQAGDIIKTAKASTAQIKLSDGTLVALKPSSEWNLQEFVYNKQNPGLGKQSSELLKGGLRAVTGLIGKADPKKIKYTAGTTTIGIRGTTFELVLIPKGIERGVYVQVETGQVLVSNKFGSMNAYPQKIVKTTTNQAPVEIFSTKVFKPVDEDINKDKESFQTQTKKQANNKSAKQTQEEEQEDNSQQNSSAEISLKNLTDDEPLPDRKISAINTKISQIVEAQTDKREETLKYHTLALQIKDSGVFSGETFFNDPDLNAATVNTYIQIELNKKLREFINSQGEFKGKGYKELKAAYDKLPASEKAKLAALPTLDKTLTTDNKADKQTMARDPLRYFKIFTETEKSGARFNPNNNKIEFTKFKEQNTSSLMGEGMISFTSKGTFTFTNPKQTYRYKLDTDATKLVFEKDHDVFDINLEGSNFILVNFADKKFEDANLNYKVNGIEYIYKGVEARSFILDSGLFFLTFANLTIGGAENNKFLDQTAITGNFYQNSSDKNMAVGVFGANFTEQSAGSTKNYHIGYVTFKQE